jgi:hypothetical protein
MTLEALVREYIRDLRRNSSGGDDYPWEYAKGTAEYLEELVRRAHTCDVAQPVAWRYRHRGDPWSVCDTKPDEHVPGMLEVQPLYAAQPPAAPVVPPEVLERRRKGLPDYERPPLGQPPSWLQEQEKIERHNGSSAATEDALGYAQRLATILWEKHWKADAPEWKPLPDLVGVLTQIDNAVAGLVRAVPQSIKVTDAMCEAALDADVPDRIQGFSYKSKHVIRDVWSDEEIWTAPVVGPKEYQAFQKQCRIERMRKTLEAACSLSRPHQP